MWGSSGPAAHARHAHRRTQASPPGIDFWLVELVSHQSFQISVGTVFFLPALNR
jgi:hypothetical protein